MYTKDFASSSNGEGKASWICIVITAAVIKDDNLDFSNRL